MTELQKKEFEMLKYVVKICDDLNICYYLVCGSALGAAKYHGFIPWDDDIDIGFPRNDYERFLIEAPRFLPRYLFLQNYKTDPLSPFIFSKIRNSKTTYIEKSVKNIKMNHGVFIDIFPLDGYPTELKEQIKFEKKKIKYFRLSSINTERKRSLKGKIFRYLFKTIGLKKITMFYLKRYNDLIKRYQIENSNLICNHGNWQGKLEYAPRWHYGNGTWATFEGLKVRIPENYDAYLTQKYGDWRADLPEEQKVGHHYYKVCDLNRPYTDYIERVSKGGRCIKLKNDKM